MSFKVRRDPVCYSDCPEYGWGDGELYHFVRDGGPACDVVTSDGPGPEGSRSRCRLPVGHGGDHLPFSLELIEQTGVRVSVIESVSQGVT